MKTFKKIKFLYLIIILSIIFAFPAKNVFAIDNFAEIVIEQSTNRILYDKNMHKKLPIASTTKILTAITVIDNIDLDTIVKITKDMVGIEGSSAYLTVGEELTVSDLLFGLMLRSGNDCAVALAIAVSGSVTNFCNLMNTHAHHIGAINSNFNNPHGLPDDNHYSTAYDLAIITSYAMKNSAFAKIVSAKSIKIGDNLWINKNKMLNIYPGANGVKTGYTKKAGRCLVTSAQQNEMQLISVVLNCNDMWNRSCSLLDSCFNEYTMTKVFDSSYVIDNVKVKNSNKKCGIYAKKDVYLPLKENEYDKIKIVYDYPKYLKAPINRDTNCGKINFFLDNYLLFSENIYTINNIK